MIELIWTGLVFGVAYFLGWKTSWSYAGKKVHDMLDSGELVFLGRKKDVR